MTINPAQLEERLIDFAVLCIKISDTIRKTNAGQHLANQLVRSAKSPALNYGEARSGESRRDFIHKIKIALKELRETIVCLKIISRATLSAKPDLIESARAENNELIAIFISTVNTARKNMLRGTA